MSGIRRLQPGRVCDDYGYDSEEKAVMYKALLEAMGSKPINTACTFPKDSNYKFELSILAKNRTASVDCFEKDQNTYDVISRRCCVDPEGNEDRDKRIVLINKKVEHYLEARPHMRYDLMWFDYCGATPYDVSDLVYRHLNTGGVFAMTVCDKRNPWDRIKHPNLFPVINDYRYGSAMLFMAFVKDVKPERIITITPPVHKEVKVVLHPDYSNKYIVMDLYKRYSQQLSEEQQQTIAMRYIQNVSVKDTANVLGISIATVSYRVGAALSRMKKLSRRNKAAPRKPDTIKNAVMSLFKLYGGKLTTNLKEIVTLRFQQNLSVRETSNKLGISEANVYASISYAERKMRQYEDLNKKGKFVAERAPEGRDEPSLKFLDSVHRTKEQAIR
jgi:DNA-directed RNA polymerase specialized sigma24 family protein